MSYSINKNKFSRSVKSLLVIQISFLLIACGGGASETNNGMAPTPIVDNPTTTPPVDNPTTTPTVDNPTTTPTVDNPTTTPTVDNPTTTPPVDNPTTTPTVDNPTTTPPVDNPTTTPPVDNPTTTPPVDNPTTTPPVDNPTTTGTSGITPNEAQRFLTKATFGATPADIQRVIALGYEGWIDEQFTIPSTKLLEFNDKAIKDRNIARRQRLLQEGETDPSILDRDMGKGQRSFSRLDAWWHASINGKDQLRQRMAFALSQIFVVGDALGDSALPNRGYSYYYDLLVKNSLESYRDLIEDVTISPAMSSFLSLRGNIRTGRGGSTALPDENYSRESLQLFSIGLVELNLDGTPKLVNGREVETYDQDIIADFSRIYTGWNFRTGRAQPGWEAEQLEPWGGEPNNFHDYESKVLFDNKVVPAGITSNQDLDAAMDSIFNHPNVGPFISKQLIQRFVTSNPSPAYVARVATIFNNNGSGIRGDLGAVIKAILLDDESINSHKIKNGGKLKEPLIRISQLWRTFEAKSPIQYIRFGIPTRFTGQRPLGAASVFNFYEPTYSPGGTLTDMGLVAPEFRLMGDALNISYLNRLSQIVRSTEFGDPNTLYSGSHSLPMKLNLDEAMQLSNDFEAMLDYYNDMLFGGLMSDSLRTAVITYLSTLPDESDAAKRSETIAEEALMLLTASPEFNVQR